MALRITPVILAGGTGSRLWPASSRERPKQFLDLLPKGLSPFQSTLQRVSGEPFGRPIIMVNADCEAIAIEQTRSAGLDGDIIVEPEPRGTALAAAVAAHAAATWRSGSLCLMLASDHMVEDAARFQADCIVAARIAADDRIVVFGLAPDHPHTGYGYIDPGELLVPERAHAVRRFVEKPGPRDAERFVRDGYLWNSGNLLFDPATLIAELEFGAPLVSAAGFSAFNRMSSFEGMHRLPPETDTVVDRISIDHALLEKTSRAVVIRASFGWTDIGSWNALYDISARDDDGNAFTGPVHAISTRNSLLYSDGPAVAVIGLENVAVVAAEGALLVANRNEASKVKELATALEPHKKRMHRPWGWYRRIASGPGFQVKELHVKIGAALSLQMHRHRAEHWTIVQGTAEIRSGAETGIFAAGSNVYIPSECIHRLRNAGDTELVVIEVQTGSYLGEDDIVRFEDLYNRV